MASTTSSQSMVLTMNYIAEDKEGTYTCQVIADGVTVEHEIELAVIAFTDHPTSQSAEPGDTITLTCVTEGAPAGLSPTSYWLKDGSSVDNSLLTNTDSSGSAVTSELVFGSVTSTMDGDYVCNVVFGDQVSFSL